MISVYDNKQNIDAPIILTTINCDGIYRYWNADNMEEFHRWWQDENYDGPSGDDEVVEFIIYNGGMKYDMKALNPSIKYFENIVKLYDFDKEVEVEDLEFNV